jgi:hypothetical protein
MTRWITFDERTAVFAHRTGVQNVELSAGDALTAALANDKAVCVVPAGSEAAVLRFEKRVEETAAPNIARWEDPDAVGYAAGGMLGLRDEPVYEEEQKPKSWWRRFWGE